MDIKINKKWNCKNLGIAVYNGNIHIVWQEDKDSIIFERNMHYSDEKEAFLNFIDSYFDNSFINYLEVK